MCDGVLVVVAVVAAAASAEIPLGNFRRGHTVIQNCHCRFSSWNSFKKSQKIEQTHFHGLSKWLATDL